MDKAEIVKLREFLRRSLARRRASGCANTKSSEAADVSLGERKLGTITSTTRTVTVPSRSK